MAHALQHVGKSSQVPSLHEYQLSFLWNVLSGLDRAHPRIQPAGRAPKNHRWGSGKWLTKSLQSPALTEEDNDSAGPESQALPSSPQTATVHTAIPGRGTWSRTPFLLISGSGTLKASYKTSSNQGQVGKWQECGKGQPPTQPIPSHACTWSLLRTKEARVCVVCPVPPQRVQGC